MSFLLGAGKFARGLQTAANVRQITSRTLGQGDHVTLFVRMGRIVYAYQASVILILWYTGWRNERVAEGDTGFVFPGYTKTRPQYPVDRRAEDIDVQGLLKGAGSYSGALDATAAGAGGLAGTPNLAGDTGKKREATPIPVGKEAQRLGMRVGEHPAFGGVSPVHSATSLHDQGQAIDVNGPAGSNEVKMEDAYANFLIVTYGIGAFAEVIWNGPHPVSVKNGKAVPPSFWGAETWNNHKDHVHVGFFSQ